MYFWTNSIWMFLIFLPFNSLKCYYVGAVCLGSNLSLLENLWKPLLLGSEANFCLFLSLYIQSELEIMEMIWTGGIAPKHMPSLHGDRTLTPRGGSYLNAIALLKFLIIEFCKTYERDAGTLIDLKQERMWAETPVNVCLQCFCTLWSEHRLPVDLPREIQWELKSRLKVKAVWVNKLRRGEELMRVLTAQKGHILHLHKIFLWMQKKWLGCSENYEPRKVIISFWCVY